jgi:hypothetical protein
MQNFPPFFSIIINFCCVLFGGLITFLLSRWYYVKASKGLKDATKEINEMSNFIVHILEQNDNKQWEIKRDDQGKIIGLNISVTISECAHAQDSSEAIVIKQSQRDMNS